MKGGGFCRLSVLRKNERRYKKDDDIGERSLCLLPSGTGCSAGAVVSITGLTLKSHVPKSRKRKGGGRSEVVTFSNDHADGQGNENKNHKAGSVASKEAINIV